MLFGIGSRLLYALTRVALPPLALAHMGLAEYGLWAACFVIVGYLGMTASGFTVVYLRGVARAHAAGDVAAASRLVSTGVLTLSALAVALLASVHAALPALLDLLNVPVAQHRLAGILWMAACAVFLVDMSLGAFASVLHAVGRVRTEQRIWIAAFVLETAALVLLLLAGLGVFALVWAFALRYAFSIVATAVAARRALPGLRLSPRLFEPRLLREFAGLGAGMQLSSLAATALHSADRLLAGALLGPAATAVVDLAGKLPVTAGSLASQASTVALAASARHAVQGQARALSQVYVDAMRVTVGVLSLSLPFLIVFAPLVCVAWLGPQQPAATVAQVMPWLAGGLMAHLLTGPATAAQRGRGRLGSDFALHGLRLAMLVAAGLAWHLSGTADVVHLAAAMGAGQAAAAALFLCAAHRRECGSFAGLGRDVALPLAAAFALALTLAALAAAQGAAAPATRAAALLQLAAALALWLALAFPVLAALLLRRDEWQALRERARRVWPHSGAGWRKA